MLEFHYTTSDFIATITVLISAISLVASIRGNQKKLSVYQKIDPLFSQVFRRECHKETELSSIPITIKDTRLYDPCMITIDITYTGKEALLDPCIILSPPPGSCLIYEYTISHSHGKDELCSVTKMGNDTYELKLAYINPKQSVKAIFLMDKIPDRRIAVSCSMPNLTVYESGYIDNKLKTNASFLTRSNAILLVITGIIGTTSQYWSQWVVKGAFLLRGYIPPAYSVPFVLLTLILGMLFNAINFPSITKSWVSNDEKRRRIMLGIISFSTIGFYFLAKICTTLFQAFFQFAFGCIVIFLLAILIRLITVEFEYKS